jgi:uncharacterized protein (DUF983 family)
MNYDSEDDIEEELDEKCPRCGGPVFRYFLHCDPTIRCDRCATLWSENEWETDPDRAKPEPTTSPATTIL